MLPPKSSALHNDPNKMSSFCNIPPPKLAELGTENWAPDLQSTL